MNSLTERFRCLLGHKWGNATFSYEVFKDDTCEEKIEKALCCSRCGKFIIPHSEYYKYLPRDQLLKEKYD